MNKNTSKKRKLRPANKDLADLLLSTTEFRKDVNQIRNHIGLPFDGFKTTDQREEFFNKLNKRDFAIIESDEYFRQTNEIERKYREHIIDERTYTLQKRLHRDKYWFWYLKNMAEYLCYKYNLPYTFKEHLEKYILSDDRSKMSYPITNYDFTFDGGNPFSVHNIHSVSLNVYARLTYDDMEKIKKILDKITKDLPNHPRIKGVEEKLQYENWYKEERQYVDGSVSLADKSEEYLGSKKKVYKIQNAVRELKNLRNKRLKRRDVN